ncbi:MAG: DUF2149 domain-containing protein [Alphaproteobacteria bacterium]|nr:DUF2149 domain-containing protein [Alphaproteobacteria bacterium]
MKRKSLLRRNADDDVDPLCSLGNLFDVAMILAVGFMVATVSYLNIADLLAKDEFTMVKNPGKPDMEIITKDQQKITRYAATDQQAEPGARGKRVGAAYQLESGEIIYVPE